jgi:hypothetical protein
VLRATPEEICIDDCINRLTQVECLPGDCKGGAFCMNQRCVARLGVYVVGGSFLTLHKVPTTRLCENRDCQDGEKRVRASGGGEHAQVRSQSPVVLILILTRGCGHKGYVHLRIRWRCRFESDVHQANAGVCGRGNQAFLLYDAAEGRGE